MNARPIDDEDDLRTAFWEAHPDLAAAAHARFGRHPEDVRQNRHDTDTRCAFVDWLDGMARNGDVSAELADSATL